MTIKHARSPSPPSNVSSRLDDFATRGWVYVRNLLSPPELRVLQTECSALYACQSTESIAAQGCVVDVMAQCPMRDSDTARVESSCYLEARARELQGGDVDDQRVFASLLFEKLPTIAGQLMSACDESETATSVFFFNEHYVVKPPRSHVEFRWHRDDDEQLAMCVHRQSIRAYVSAWCALDDVTRVNGALQFVSLDLLSESDGGTAESLQRHASAPVTVEAGDVLFFLSNVWHCSSSNESDGVRRAFYAQYSREKITSRLKDPLPLSFAIPCRTTSFALVAGGSSEGSGGERTKQVKHVEL